MIRQVSGLTLTKSLDYDHGQSLKVAKAIFGLGTSQLAKEWDVRPQNVGKWMNTKNWQQDRLEMVSSFFSMSVKDFEMLAFTGLSQGAAHDCEVLVNHLRESRRGNSQQINQIERAYQKIISALEQIEGVA